MKAMTKFGHHKHRHIPCQASEGVFVENIYRLKVVNYFRKKIFILDAWLNALEEEWKYSFYETRDNPLE